MVASGRLLAGTPQETALLFRKAERGAIMKGVSRMCGVEGSDSLPTRIKRGFLKVLSDRARSLKQEPLVVDPETGKVDWLQLGWFKLLPQHPADAPKSKTTRHLQVECNLDHQVRPCSSFRKARSAR